MQTCCGGERGKRRRRRLAEARERMPTDRRRLEGGGSADREFSPSIRRLLSFLAAASPLLRAQREMTMNMRSQRIAARDVPHGVEGKGRRKRSVEFLLRHVKARERVREGERAKRAKREKQKNAEKKNSSFFSLLLLFFSFPSLELLKRDGHSRQADRCVSPL